MRHLQKKSNRSDRALVYRLDTNFECHPESTFVLYAELLVGLKRQVG